MVIKKLVLDKDLSEINKSYNCINPNRLVLT